MRVIQSNEVRMTPMHCAVVPTIGQVSGHRFIDTGYDMYVNSVNTPNRIYISEPAVHDMAVKFGWTPPSEVAVMASRVRELEIQVADLEARAAEAEQFQAAVDVIESADFRARRKAGRPKAAAA